MIPFHASGLTQTVEFELLDRERKSVGDLDGVLSFSVERNQYASPMSGGSITVRLAQPLDLSGSVIRPWVTCSFPGYDDETYPLLTGIPFITGQQRTAAVGTVVTFKLLDYSRDLDVPLGRNVTVNPGDLVTAKVREVLAAKGAADAVITESSATVAAGMFFGATTTVRQYVNELLGAIGYRAVWADAMGRLHVEPYVRPADRPTVPDLGFIHGKTATYRPELTIEHDVSNVPNHAVITCRMAQDVETVVGEAWLPADHPYSFERRKVEIPWSAADVEIAGPTLAEGADAAAVAAYRAAVKPLADTYALRKLYELAAPSRSYLVNNRWRPCEIMDVTRFYSPATPFSPVIDSRVSIVKDSVSYSKGGTLKVSTTLQEVVQ